MGIEDRIVLGQAEQVAFRVGGWQKARMGQQMCDWFGDVPAFIIPRQQIESHDPTKMSGKGLSAKWKQLFEETRKRFREDTAPTANFASAARPGWPKSPRACATWP